jgi:hypothetical protein
MSGVRANRSLDLETWHCGGTEVLGMKDEGSDMPLVGAENAGRVMLIMGTAMILLRLVTHTAVSFKAEA